MRIRVDRASPTVDPSRSAFVGGLPYGAEESSLQEHFAKGCDLDFKDIEGVRIIRDKENFQCKGFGYVLFRETNMVPAALKLHESIYLNRPIRVMVCGKRFKGKKEDQNAGKPKYKASQEKEKVTVGAFRRIIAKQQKEAVQTHKRKRGDKKKATTTKAAAGGLSKRAAIDKKVEKKVKKLQKRISKGMGKSKRG
jgi:RNA recognition motif-containing protein